jgi:hypothetical protein
VGNRVGEGDRGLGQSAVGERDAVERVLPPLVEQSGVGCPLVLDEAVAVAVAVDPLQRPVRRRQQLGDVGRVGAPEMQPTRWPAKPGATMPRDGRSWRPAFSFNDD